MPNNKRPPGRRQRRAIWDAQEAKGRAHLRRRYGLTDQQLQYMKQKQGGVCVICTRKLPAKFAVDHDHEKAKLHGHSDLTGCPKCVRGLLCFNCNRILGEFDTVSRLGGKEVQEVIARFSAYLKVTGSSRA